MRQPNTIKLGLTGSIGMGKSTVSEIFRQADIAVFDADACVRELQKPGGKAIPAIKAAFPSVVKNGVLDRTLLRDIIFSNPQAKEDIEAILHPQVSIEREKFKQKAEKEGRHFIVYDIPLLFEARGQGGTERVLDALDATILVSAPYELQKARVLARPHMTEAMFEKIVSEQMPDSEKRRRADYILENDGSLTHLKEKVDALIETLEQRYGIGEKGENGRA